MWHYFDTVAFTHKCTCIAIMQAKLLLSFEQVLRAVHLQRRFAFQYKIVKPFEKLRWYGKLKLGLWGGERYCSQSSLEKVGSSQNCKVFKLVSTKINDRDSCTLSIDSGCNRGLEGKSKLNILISE